MNSNVCTTDLTAWKHEWQKYPWAVQSRPGSWCGQLPSPCWPVQWTWRRCLSSRHSPHTASDPLDVEAVMITLSSALSLQRHHHIIVSAIKRTTQSLRDTWQTTFSTFNKQSSEIMEKYSMLQLHTDTCPRYLHLIVTQICHWNMYCFLLGKFSWIIEQLCYQVTNDTCMQKPWSSQFSHWRYGGHSVSLSQPSNAGFSCQYVCTVIPTKQCWVLMPVRLHRDTNQAMLGSHASTFAPWYQPSNAGFSCQYFCTMIPTKQCWVLMPVNQLCDTNQAMLGSHESKFALWY